MREQRAKMTAMDDGAERLHGQLRDVVDLIRRSGGGLVFDEFPGAPQEEPRTGRPADGVVASEVRMAPHASAAAHGALIDAADGLAATLAPLHATAWHTHPVRSRGATQ